MTQLSFKIPDSEMAFLKWFSEKTAQPISSVYRNVTLESFREWKTSLLLKEYQTGSIGFKTMCNLSNISFNQGVLLLQQHNIEPPISDLLSEYSSKVADQLLEKGLFKGLKRELKEVHLREGN